MKRFGSMLLLFVMILSMSIPAFASNKGGGKIGSGDNILVIHKINVTALEKGLEADPGSYEGIKATGAKVIGNTVVGSCQKKGEKFDVTAEQLDKYTLDGIKFTITQVEPKETTAPGSVKVDDYKPVDNGLNDNTTTDNGMITWTGLVNGYYRVTEDKSETAITSDKVDFIVSLPMVVNDQVSGSKETITEVHAYPKNKVGEGPTIKKEAASIVNTNDGTEVKWSITSDIPTTITGSKNEQYVITDSWGSNLTYTADSVSVYYKNKNENSVPLEKNTHYTLKDSSNGFEIKLTSSGLNKFVSAIKNKDISPEMLLHVDYSNIVSISDVNWSELTRDASRVTNNVEVAYTNDNSYNFEPGKANTSPNIYQIKVTKRDGDNNVMLKGAEFQLRTTKNKLVVLKDENGQSVSTVTTKSDGLAYFSGLPAGNYLLEETKAPDGYKGLNGSLTVTIPDDADAYSTINVDVDNFYDNSLTLPQTGGMGTIIFTIVGIGLIVIAGIILIVSKKGKNNNS